MIIPKKSKTYITDSGFTLIEVIIALGVSAATATVLTLVSMAGIRSLRELRRTERLHASAQHLTDHIAYYVRQSAFAQSPNAQTAQLYVPTATSHVPVVFLFNTATKRLTRDETDNGIADGVDLLPQHIRTTYFAWQVLPQSVRYGFTLKEDYGGNSFSATTAVALRNDF